MTKRNITSPDHIATTKRPLTEEARTLAQLHAEVQALPPLPADKHACFVKWTDGTPSDKIYENINAILEAIAADPELKDVVGEDDMSTTKDDNFIITGLTEGKQASSQV